MANVEVRQDNQPTVIADTPDGAFAAGEAARRSVELESKARRQFFVHIAIGVALSLVWLFVSLSYAVSEIGVIELFAQPAHQIAIIVLAIVGPMILVWLVLSYVRRDRELRGHRLSLEARLDLLTYPDTAAGARVREVTTALQRQTEELSRASLAAVERVRDADELLRQRANQLWQASDGARNKADDLAREIGDSAQALEQSVEGITLKGDDLSALLRNHSDSLEDAVKEGVQRMQEIVSAFEDRMGDLHTLTDKASDIAAERAEGLKEDIIGQLNSLALTVDHAAGKIEKTSIAVGATIREEMEKATAHTEQNTDRISSTIENLQQRTASLTSDFGNDVEKIVGEIDSVASKAGDIEHQLREHLDNMSNTIDTADQKSEKIAASLRESGASLGDMVDGVLAKADGANEQLSGKLTDLLSAADRVASRSQEMSTAVHSAEQQLSEIGENFEHHTATLKETAEVATGQLTAAGETAASNAENLRGAISGAEENANSFATRALELAGKLRDITDIFDSKSGAMGNQAENLITNLQARGDVLESQIGRIGSAADLAKAEANALEDVFSHHISQLEDAADKAAATGNSIGENLDTRTQALEKVTGGISELDASLSANLENLLKNAADLSEATEGNSRDLKDLVERLAFNRDEAFTAGNIAVAAYDKVNQALKENATNLVSASHETSLVVDQIDTLSTALQGHISNLGGSLEQEVGKLTQAELMFKDGLANVGETVDLESARLDAAQQKISEASGGLSEQINHLHDASETIAGSVNKLAEGLGGQFEGVEARAEVVRDTIENLMSNLEARAKELDDAALHSSEVARLVTQAFHKQAQDLMAASEQASQRTEEVYARNAGAQRKSFMRDLSFITESLNSKSIDITRAIEQNVPEEAWSKYLQGDRTVFTRSLLKRDDNFSLLAIKSQYQEDEEFRNHANRYLTLFEEAVEQAEENDPEEVLSSTLLSSDVGKLYLLLSRALGRIR